MKKQDGCASFFAPLWKNSLARASFVVRCLPAAGLLIVGKGRRHLFDGYRLLRS